MKLSSILCRNARAPQNVNKVPFKELLPLKLKERVSSKSQKTSERGCLYEVSLLLKCLDENNFENKNCISQVNALETCYSRYAENNTRQRLQHQQNVPVPNSKNLTYNQTTYLLRRYPTI